MKIKAAKLSERSERSGEELETRTVEATRIWSSPPVSRKDH